MSCSPIFLPCWLNLSSFTHILELQHAQKYSTVGIIMTEKAVLTGEHVLQPEASTFTGWYRVQGFIFSCSCYIFYSLSKQVNAYSHIQDAECVSDGWLLTAGLLYATTKVTFLVTDEGSVWQANIPCMFLDAFQRTFYLNILLHMPKLINQPICRIFWVK